MRTTRAALLYFAIIFGLGFALGTVRTLLIAPHLGPLMATVLELPVMVAVSWRACGDVMARLPVPPTFASRLAMGGLALALLLVAEACISIFLAGQTLSQHFALYLTAPVQLGLIGQLAFAAFPLIRR